MSKIFEHLSWWFVLLFAVPTVLIIGSWSSLPGEPMYGIKQAFEDVMMLAARPSYAAQGRLSITFTERRYAEATTLLASRQSIEGLPYLEKQVQETKAVIAQAPSTAKQKQLAQAYVGTLKTVQSGLEQQKQALASSSPLSPSPTKIETRQPPTATRQPLPTATPLPTQGQTGSRATPTKPPQPTPPPPQPPPEQIINEITETQEEIEEVINELEEEVLQSESQLDTEEQRDEKKEQDKDKGDRDEDRGRSEERRRDDGEKKDKEKDGDKEKND